MLKKVFLTALFLAAALPGMLRAQKIYDINSSQEALLEPADAARKSSFRVNCDLKGLLFQFDVQGKKATLEVFFRTSSAMPDSAYHQFYAELDGAPAELKEKYFPALTHLGFVPHRNRSFTPHYYWFEPQRKDFPFLGTYQCDAKLKDDGYEASLFIPWIAFRGCLPFDKNGKGAEWDFTVLRSEAEPVLSWQGTFHQPKTWGKLRFPDVTEKELKQIYAGICRQGVTDAMPVPEFLFTPDSLSAGKANREEALRQNAARVADEEKVKSLSLDLLQSLAEKTWRDTQGRIILTYLPERRKTAELPAGWTRTEDPAAAAVTLTYRPEKATAEPLVMQFMSFRPMTACEKKVTWKVNGKTPASGEFAAGDDVFPFVLSPAGAEEVSFTFYGSKGKLPMFAFGTSLFEYRFGFAPKKEISTVDGRLLMRDDATICMHHHGRNIFQQLSMLLQEPTVIIGGSGTLDGMDALPLYRNRICGKGPIGDMGMVGSDQRNHIWRLRNVKYNLFPVKTFVLYPPYCGKLKDDITYTQAAIDAVRAQLPDAKIILCGPIPSKQGVNADLVRELAKLANGKDIIFADCTAKFLNADGTVNMTLWGRIFPTEQGYAAWYDVVEPLL